MDLIPAIDLLDGQVVRLHQGRYDAATTYGSNPAEFAARFEAAGATRLHVVDLNGARTGTAFHRDVISDMLKNSKLAVQVGGGVRDAAIARQWFEAGADRVITGTAAMKNPAFAEYLCTAHKNRVVIAIDAKNGMVAIDGWVNETETRATDFAQKVDAWKPAAILFTVIERDGTKDGPDVEATAALQSLVSTTVIASGGIGTLAHLAALRESGVRATVCGKALYSGAFTLDEAFRVANGGAA